MKPRKTSLILCDAQKTDNGGFAFVRKRLGAAVGAKGLGTSWFELQPGKKAFPFHFHTANEEAIFILEGEGTLRFGTGDAAAADARKAPSTDHPLRPGDYVSFPPGPPGHQVVNTGSQPLRFLALSTMIEPEVAVYPDSKKVGVLARSLGIVAVHRDANAVDYYEDEE